jgi:excisionase family DNA binding protein
MASTDQIIPDLPSEQDVELARETGRKIAAIIGQGDTAQLCVQDGDDRFVVPMGAMKLLAEILNQMAQGNAFTLMPVGYMLTTQQAADLMNVSRPYFVKLLEKGEIPFTRAGRHRRVKHEDLVAFMRKIDSESNDAMAELAKQSQELKMGY